MSEFLVCYDCGSVRDPEYHAGHDCKTLCRLRAELAAAKAEVDIYRAALESIELLGGYAGGWAREALAKGKR